MMEPVTEDAIEQAIDQACQNTQERWKSSSFSRDHHLQFHHDDFTLRRIKCNEDLELMLQLLDNENENVTATHHAEPMPSSQPQIQAQSQSNKSCRMIDPTARQETRGILLFQKSNDDKVNLTDAATTCGRLVGFATFYLAYSTWDGRIIDLDRLMIVFPNNSSTITVEDSSSSSTITDHSQSLEWSLRCTIAEIALLLHCRCVLWQEACTTNSHNKLPVPPDDLSEWITMQMDRPAMNQLIVGGDGTNNHPNSVAIDDDTTAIIPNEPMVWNVTMEQCLQEWNDNNKQQQPCWKVRLATADDVHDMYRLVMGMVEFEEEPDPPHVTAEDFRRDGGFTAIANRDPHHQQQQDVPWSPPWFYCLLLEDTTTSSSSSSSRAASVTTTHRPSYNYVFAMAVFYIGHAFPTGRFLYLEELFVEPDYRGKRAGTTLMHLLTRLGQVLQCHRLKWLCLDWNTQAIEFYQNTFGAQIQDRVCTLQWEGKEELEEVVATAWQQYSEEEDEEKDDNNEQEQLQTQQQTPND